MIKIALYLLLVFVLVGASAWLGQTWRYEGAAEESKQETAGGVLFETFKADAEALALKIVAEKERDGQSDGSAIVQAGRAEGRILAFEGQALRVHVESSGELATRKFYLDPIFGAQRAITELSEKLEGNLPAEERENVTVALKVLINSKEQVRDTLNYVRVNQAKRASDDYLRRGGRCGPSSYLASGGNAASGGVQ